MTDERVSVGNDYWSHLSESNGRPTVYEACGVEREDSQSRGVAERDDTRDVKRFICARLAGLICAWGSPSDTYVRKNTAVRARDVARILRHRDLHCLGTAKDGQPRHPLYLAASLTPVAWRAP